MKENVMFLAAVLMAVPGMQVSGQQLPDSVQIAGAVSPLPAGMQAGAKVLGYHAGKLVTLREGSNEMICLADDPGRKGFHAACYHESLEPFMARGRELRAQGMSRDQVQAQRLEDVKTGRWSMPDKPAALYSVTGPEGSFDPASGPTDQARRLFVVYMPYATPEEVGVPAQPSRVRPWLMFPGTPWAHIMVIGK